ncbi:MAG TPA: ExeM/NucH family extracellular endonuclease [Myxococcota bacterium]|nr:ExeM/NucH family extracellular endonuclease [Myxococcota bacterium]
MRVSLVSALAAALAAPCAAADSEQCGAPATAIHAIQGGGASSPLAGRAGVAVEGIVVGDFRGFPEGLGGVFVQEEDADADADPATSEGLFLFAPDLAGEIRTGDTVRARGEVREFFGSTELGRIEWVKRCAARGDASAVSLALPLPEGWEPVEGMLVRIEHPLVVSGAEDLGRFGELVLAPGERLFAPTQRAAPGDAARAWQDRNQRHRVLLDDGSHAAWPDPTPYLETAPSRTLRLGDRAPGIEGVVDFSFGRFRVHPTVPVRFESAGARPAPPRARRGTLRVAAWNVENFFNGDGDGGGFPTRGAASARELERQRAKIAAALAAVDADVFALAEIENDGTGPGSAARELAAALSERIGAPVAVVDPGRGALGEQEISVGLLYRSDRVAPVGVPAVLDANADPDFDTSRNRPSLARSFVHAGTGERVTVAINHWKSKGSPCDGATDPDVGDGQGNCNRTRARAAASLASWLATDPTRAGAPALIVGDLNSYPNEDPLAALAAAGFVDLLARFGGPDVYSYVFDGAAGRLDHALASPELARLAGGAAVWHANSDEPPLFDYREDNPPPAYVANAYRASDHDPVLVDLFPDRDGDSRTDARDACPHTPRRATVVWNGCDTGVPERIDAAGCSLGDRLRALRPVGVDRGALAWPLRSWLIERFADGTLSPRESVAILVCGRKIGRRRTGGAPWHRRAPRLWTGASRS